MAAFASPPLFDPIAVSADSKHPMAARLPKLLMGLEWLKWLGELTLQLDEKPARKNHVRLVNQNASLATTPIPLGEIPPGLWRISYHVRVTVPGTVSSSIQVTLAWTDGGVSQSEAGAALNGNLTTTRECATRIIRVDNASPISYATTYASAGATAMRYALDVVAEALALDV